MPGPRQHPNRLKLGNVTQITLPRGQKDLRSADVSSRQMSGLRLDGGVPSRYEVSFAKGCPDKRICHVAATSAASP
jgi:hypothetical protein